MQELFAKEIPVAFAIDWKQSSDGNLSDAIQEKVESSGRNLPRFSCSSTASFLSQQGREESGHLQWFCMSVCLSKLIHDGEAAWESSLSEVKFVAFAGPVCSPISHRWVWSEWRASNSSLCHCYRSVSKGAANGHVLDTATSWVLDGAIFPWSTDHIYIFIFVHWICFMMLCIAWNFGRWRLETVQHTWRRSWRSFHCQSKCSGWSLIDFDRTFSRFGTALGRLGYT